MFRRPDVQLDHYMGQAEHRKTIGQHICEEHIYLYTEIRLFSVATVFTAESGPKFGRTILSSTKCTSQRPLLCVVGRHVGWWNA